MPAASGLGRDDEWRREGVRKRERHVTASRSLQDDVGMCAKRRIEQLVLQGGRCRRQRVVRGSAHAVGGSAHAGCRKCVLCSHFSGQSFWFVLDSLGIVTMPQTHVSFTSLPTSRDRQRLDRELLGRQLDFSRLDVVYRVVAWRGMHSCAAVLAELIR